MKLHKDLRSKLGDVPALCDLVAHGNSLAAGELWRAQDFATRAWARVGIVAVLAIFPVIGLGAALHPGRIGTDIGTTLIFSLGCLMGVALAQMGLLRYRADQTKSHMRRGGRQARGQPLPPGAGGRPRRSDFWVMLLIVVVFGAMLFAAANSAQN